MKQVVYIRTYHGKQLDDLADEVRRTYVRFPNTIKVIFDHRGLGDAFHLFFQDPWIDPETGKEYPPWVLDSEKNYMASAEPLLYSFKANVALNQQLASCLRVAIEQRTIALPIGSHDAGAADGDDSRRKLTMEEKAIYIEADALQVEMGNIILKTSGAGNYTYDTAKPTQHKDRYSSLAMGVWYIAQMEDTRKRKIHQRRNDMCVGVVSYF